MHAVLAPGNADRLRVQSDPDERPPRLRQPMPDDIIQLIPHCTLCLPHAAELEEALRTWQRCSLSGAGAAVEHYRLHAA